MQIIDPENFDASKGPYNVEIGDIADWCFLPTYILLNSFKDVLRPGQVPVYKKGHFGVYDPAAKRDKMSSSEKFNEDKIILLQLLPEFAFMQRLKLKPPAKDETTRGLVNFVANKRIPLGLCFVTQISLDTHHTLRCSRAKAFNDLRFSA